MGLAKYARQDLSWREKKFVRIRNITSGLVNSTEKKNDNLTNGTR